LPGSCRSLFVFQQWRISHGIASKPARAEWFPRPCNCE